MCLATCLHPPRHQIRGEIDSLCTDCHHEWSEIAPVFETFMTWHLTVLQTETSSAVICDQVDSSSYGEEERRSVTRRRLDFDETSSSSSSSSSPPSLFVDDVTRQPEQHHHLCHHRQQQQQQENALRREPADVKDSATIYRPWEVSTSSSSSSPSSIQYNTIQYNTIQNICNPHNVCQLAESEARAVTGGT